MSHRILRRIISIAITDPKFRNDLINGRRSDLLVEFDLTDEECKALMAIEANSLREFATQLEGWLQIQENWRRESRDQHNSRVVTPELLTDTFPSSPLVVFNVEFRQSDFCRYSHSRMEAIDG